MSASVGPISSVASKSVKQPRTLNSPNCRTAKNTPEVGSAIHRPAISGSDASPRSPVMVVVIAFVSRWSMTLLLSQCRASSDAALARNCQDADAPRLLRDGALAAREVVLL